MARKSFTLKQGHPANRLIDAGIIVLGGYDRSMEPSLERAWQLYRFHRYSMALEETVKYLGQCPESAEGHCLLALLHGKQKDQAKANLAAEAAIRLSPNSSYAHYAHALVNTWFNNQHQALRSIHVAIKLEPDSADYYDLLAGIQFDQGQLFDALDTAEEGLEHDPNHVGCHYRRGLVFFSVGKKDQAEKIFKRVLTVDPEHAAAQGFVGCIEVERGNFQEAIPLLRSALQENSDWIHVRKAWRESIRRSYPFYGKIAGLQQLVFEKYDWHVAAITFATVWLVLFFLRTPNEPIAEWLTMGAIYSVIIGASVLFVCLLLVNGYLTLISSLLLYTNRELSRTFNWKESFRHHRKSCIVSLLILILFIQYVIRKMAE
ncbi:MAG: tetratricopeptide repeat protein [Gemmatales bacterium]